MREVSPPGQVSHQSQHSQGSPEAGHLTTEETKIGEREGHGGWDLFSIVSENRELHRESSRKMQRFP